MNRVDDHLLYWILLGMQTLGVSILFWYGVPHYREVLRDPAAHEFGLGVFLWAMPSIALMQLGYWYSFRRRLFPPEFDQPLIAHVVMCLARFGFVLASGVFSLVFLAPKPFSIPVGRSVLTIIVLFSVFCYTLELQRFGQALLGPSQQQRRT